MRKIRETPTQSRYYYNTNGEKIDYSTTGRGGPRTGRERQIIRPGGFVVDCFSNCKISLLTSCVLPADNGGISATFLTRFPILRSKSYSQIAVIVIEKRTS